MHSSLAKLLLALIASMLVLSGCSKVKSLWSDSETVAKPSYQVSMRGGLSVSWQADVDQRKPASPSGFSIPFVANSGQGVMVVAGGQDKRVHIYNDRGGEQHRIALQAACESGVAQLPNGLVVLGDLEGMLYGLDIPAGEIKWRFQMSGVMQGHPVVAGDMFLVQTSDNRLYAMNQDGGKIWSYANVHSGLTMRAGASPVVSGERIFTVMNNGDAVALKLTNGDLLWKQQLILDNDAPVLSELRIPLADPLLIPGELAGQLDDVLAIAIYQGELVFLSAQDGNRLGDRVLSLRNSPVISGKQLYVADSQGSLLALDPKSGQTMWKQQISDAELSGPLLWMGSLWVADGEGRLFKVSQHGAVEADIKLPGRIDRKPVAAGSGVLVRTDLGVLYLVH